MQPPSHNPPAHHRRSIRLKGYDYTLAGAYFVTLVTHGRENWFGEVVGGEMRLNHIGQCAAAVWQTLSNHFGLTLGEWVWMPNHMHGILILDDLVDPGKGEASGDFIDLLSPAPLPDASPLRPHGTAPGSLNAIIQNYKSVSTRRINTLRDSPGQPLWQRNYYEHIIRSADDWSRIHVYIQANPAQWEHDREFNPGT